MSWYAASSKLSFCSQALDPILKLEWQACVASGNFSHSLGLEAHATFLPSNGSTALGVVMMAVRQSKSSALCRGELKADKTAAWDSILLRWYTSGRGHRQAHPARKTHGRRSRSHGEISRSSLVNHLTQSGESGPRRRGRRHHLLDQSQASDAVWYSKGIRGREARAS